MLTRTSPNLQFSTFAGHTALLSRPLLFQAANTSGVKPQILWFAPPELRWPALPAHGGGSPGRPLGAGSAPAATRPSPPISLGIPLGL